MDKKIRSLVNMEPLHAPEGYHPDTYIRQNFSDEKPVLCSDKRGSFELGFGKAITVNDAIELLSRVKDKDKPLLADMHHYCSSMSWEEEDWCVRLICCEIKSAPLKWAQPAPDAVPTIDGQPIGPETKVYINPHDGTMVSFDVPSYRPDLVNEL